MFYISFWHIPLLVLATKVLGPLDTVYILRWGGRFLDFSVSLRLSKSLLFKMSVYFYTPQKILSVGYHKTHSLWNGKVFISELFNPSSVID